MDRVLDGDRTVLWAPGMARSNAKGGWVGGLVVGRNRSHWMLQKTIASEIWLHVNGMIVQMIQASNDK